jgi:hypothetical protein
MAKNRGTRGVRLIVAFALVALLASTSVVLAAGWTYCSDGTTSPGNRSGCSVRYAGRNCPSDPSAGPCYGYYEYNCSGQITLCTYEYPWNPDTPTQPQQGQPY